MGGGWSGLSLDSDRETTERRCAVLLFLLFALRAVHRPSVKVPPSIFFILPVRQRLSFSPSPDMFPARQWGLPELEAYCKRHYQTKPRPALTFVRLGAYHLTQAPDSYTNIIFSNGLLDPWHPGGYLESISDSLVAVKLKLGAHHLDLRESNPADPRGARLARSLEKTYAKKWLWADRLTPAYIAELDAEIKRLRDELAKVGYFY